MKNSKKTLAGIFSAVILATTMATTASAISYSSSNTNVTYSVSADEHAYVNQSRSNPYNTSTNYVLNSTYEISNNKYSITAIYGAQPFLVGSSDPYYRMAQVRAFDANGNVIVNSNPVYTTANDVTALAQKTNITYSSKLDYVVFNGDSRIQQSQSATSYCALQCRLNMY